MPARPQTHEPLIFAWNARDHSSWHLLVALLALMAGMAGFFFVFRVVHPIAQRTPTTPQHVISLDPNDPAALALIHRAQDRSFALLTDSEPSAKVESSLLAYHPSFEGHQLKLSEQSLTATTVHEPRLFTPGTNVLPPVPRRAEQPVTAAPSASLHAVLSPTLAKRAPASVALPGIALTLPTGVQFRIAVGAAGQIITALPLATIEDKAVMAQLQAAVNNLHFSPSDVTRVEWGEVSFRWEAAGQP